MASFSQRSTWDLTPSPLHAAWLARRASGARTLDLTESNPTRAGLPYARERILDALAHAGALVYEPEPLGLPSARAAVAALLAEDGARIAPEHVLLTASTSEAYAFLFQVLADAGDEVLVPAPSYPLFRFLARAAGVTLVPYPLEYASIWEVDLDAVRRLVGPRTRAVLAVSPNNPTGSFLAAHEAAALGDLGLPLVVDEVFASFPLDGPAEPGPSTVLASRAGLAGEGLVVSLSGLSKRALLPQAKLGWLAAAGAPALVRELFARLEVLGDTFLSVGAPVQHALPELLAARRPAEAAVRARTATNLATLRRTLGPSSAATVLRAEGGWYAVVRVPATRDDESWALALLEATGVHVHPGAAFDFPRGAHLVVSLLTPERTFAEGARLLGNFVDSRA